VFGIATNTGVGTKGVWGRATNGIGVNGEATGTTGTTFGVRGTSKAPTGRGVSGEATHTSGQSYGVYGRSSSMEGTGVYGRAGSVAGGNSYGVYGVSDSPFGTGVYGRSEIGVWGSGQGSGDRIGVYGEGRQGVYGKAGPNAYGVLGWSQPNMPETGAFGSGQHGVHGYGTLDGVRGTSPGCGVRGLVGSQDPALGGPAGVFGVYAGNAAGVGLQAWASGASATGFVAEAVNGALAGKVYGDFEVTGTINGALAASRIDHPLDPAERYLSHALVQSPDMLNVYSGSVSLDGRGRATVRLPRYDTALNRDHRIQLTAVGAPAPELHVAGEVERGRFQIAGGVPGQKVFWQVTGIRSDALARSHPVRVEARKARRDRGRYLHPELYGQSRADRIGFDNRPKPRKARPVREPAAPQGRPQKRNAGER
jgi:hypothetical protein